MTKGPTVHTNHGDTLVASLHIGDHLWSHRTDLGTVIEIAAGDVVSLDDPRFAGEVGSEGLWRPLDFLSENTLGIYFTEPYDPARTPVLLVYGIGGSPQDFARFYFATEADAEAFRRRWMTG